MSVLARQVYKNDLIQRALYAQSAERYQDMAFLMELAAETRMQFTDSERQMFFVAFKKIIDCRRSSWSNLNFSEKIENVSTKQLKIVQTFRAVIEEEIGEICNNVVRLLDNYLLPGCGVNESHVFYLKLKGDFYRYLANVTRGDGNKHNILNTNRAYKDAQLISKVILIPTNPTRLGVALNYAVCCYQTLNCPSKAIQIAKEAVDEAFATLDSADLNSFTDTAITLQLLRDNLVLWKGSASSSSEMGTSSGADSNNVMTD